MKNALSTLFAVSVITASLSGCVVHVGGNYDDMDGAELSSVFGSIDVDRGNRVGNVSTVNGGIDLADGVTAETLDSVNGGIDMGDDVSINSANVVNGDIEAGRNLKSSGSLTTVNGDILLDDNARVEGDLQTVNGDMRLKNSRVSGDLETVNGDVQVRGDSVIQGNIVYKRPNRDGWNWHESNVPVLTLDDSVELAGNIIIEREVRLELSNPAHQQKVIRRYSDQ